MQTFTRFALEIQVYNPETRGIKKIGVDSEDAIYKAVKIFVLEAQQLCCFQHLKHRYEMQILKMMDRKKCTKKEKMMAKKEIILVIYGQKEAPYANMVQLNHQTRQNFVVNSTHCSKNGETDVKGF